METQTHLLVRCLGLGAITAACIYVLQLAPIEGRLKQFISAGLALVGVFAMLRIGGVL